MRNWIKTLKDNDMFAWGDLVVIGLLILLSFLPLYIFSQNEAQKPEVTSSASKSAKTMIIAEISHDGEKLKEFNLTKNKGTKTYKFKDADGDYNLIEVKDHQIHIKEANCNDQVCVRQGFKSKAGETIVCLPHKLLIELKNSNGSAEDGGFIN